MMDRKKVLELDKICRVCISERKEMRPLFSEKVAEMLIECTNIKLSATEGWPDKICVQCVHSVSRCHSFKMLVERSDKELREYINSLTVRVLIEEPTTAIKQTISNNTNNKTGNNISKAATTTTPTTMAQTTVQHNQPILMQSTQQQSPQPQQQQQQQQHLQKHPFIKQQKQVPQTQLQPQKNQQKLQPKANLKHTNKQSHHTSQQSSKKLNTSNVISTTSIPNSPVIVTTTIGPPSVASLQQRKSINHQQNNRSNKKQQNQNQQIQLMQQEIQTQSTPSHQPVPVALTSSLQNSVRQTNVQNVLPQQIIQQSTGTAQLVQQQQHQIQQTLLPAPNVASANAAAATTTTAAAIPQQLVLSNGQFITAQLLPNGGGTPQIAQIISAGPTAHNTNTGAPQSITTLQPQFAPQIIQTANGQTLQIIQQPNGQQTLQLVQLVPQRALTTAHLNANNAHDDSNIAGLGNNMQTATTATIVDLDDNDDETLLDDEPTNEQHLIDDEDDELESGGVDCGAEGIDPDGDADAEMDENEEQVCETIVVEDDHMHTQHFISSNQINHHHGLAEDSLSQGEDQELEYLEDVTVTTSHHHHQHQEDHHQQYGQHVQHQHHQNQFQHHHQQQEHENQQQQHFLHENVIVDDYIIEEIPDEEEMLEDEVNEQGDIIHGIDAAEFVSEEEETSQQDHQQQHEHHQHQQQTFIEEHELQYTVLQDDDDPLVEDDVHEVFQAACNEFAHSNASGMSTSSVVQLENSMTNDSNEIMNAENTACCSGNTSVQHAPRRRKNKMAANTRQLAATASSIAAAAAGDDDVEIDSKLISEFIKQQSESFSAGRYTCNLCRQEFKQFKGLQSHMVQHSNWIRANCKKQPQCEICLKSFKGPGMLKMHMKTHQTIAKTPICNICGKTFKSKAILYRHRQIHQQRSYACAIENCRKTFSSSTTLRMHVERKHADSINALDKYKCDDCGEIFNDIMLLDDHVQLCDHGANNLVLTTSSGDISVVSGGSGGGADSVSSSIGHHQPAIGDVYVVTSG